MPSTEPMPSQSHHHYANPYISAPEPMTVETHSAPKRRTATAPDTPAADSSQPNPSSPTRTPTKRSKPTTQHTIMDIDTNMPSTPLPTPPQSTPAHTQPQDGNLQAQPSNTPRHNEPASTPPWHGHPFTAQINQYLEDMEPAPTSTHVANTLNYLWANHKTLFDQHANAGERPINLGRKTKTTINKALKQTSGTPRRGGDQAMHSPGAPTPRGVQN
jgi:hypothetical protein